MAKISFALLKHRMKKDAGSDNSLTNPDYAARIAVYDDKTAAPRVVLVEPKRRSILAILRYR